MTSLFIDGDQSARDLKSKTRLNIKTVHAVLKSLQANNYIVKIPTGDRNKVVYHLFKKKYGKAMRRFGWVKTREPKKYAKKIEQFHIRAGKRHALALKCLDRLPLTTEAKEYLLYYGLIGELSIIEPLREGSYCLYCLNQGLGLYATSYHLDKMGKRIYVCEKCGKEQDFIEIDFREK